MNIKLIFSFSLVLLLSMCYQPAFAQDEKAKEINWFTQDWAPFNIIRGQQKRNGLNDELIQFLHRYMPQYKIKWVNSDVNQFINNMKDGNDMCKVDFFKTEERSTYALYSEVPSVIDLNLRVFMFEDKAKSLGLRNPVSLPDIIANTRLKTYLPLGRKYGQVIDEILDQDPEGKDTKRKDISIKKLIKHFFNGRVDYLLEYSPVISYHAQKFKPGRGIMSYAIKETSPYIRSHVACAKTPFGEEVINEINRVLQEHRYSQEYLQILEKWHSERNKNELRRHYEHF